MKDAVEVSDWMLVNGVSREIVMELVRGKQRGTTTGLWAFG